MKLNKKEKDWVSHLSITDKIKIVPFDKSTEDKFEKIKSYINDQIGDYVEVKHCGASSLGISGQDEIDVYIPILEEEFNKYTKRLTKLFGEPRSNYPLERTRFKTSIDKKRIDVFLINKESDGWLNSVKFENYLRKNKDCLKRYEILKESGDGMSVKEYYEKKIMFINSVLKRCI